jgi:predicted RNA-binding Zn-ribbon protein involved in translation (DUF1610 family)
MRPDVANQVHLRPIPELDLVMLAKVTVEDSSTAVADIAPSEAASDCAYCCGSCGAVLIEGASFERVYGFILKCGACGQFNETW